MAARFTRSPNGVFAGVCKGLAETFDVDVTLVRVFWLLAFFLGGFGGLLYVALAFALPRKDRLEKAHHDKILGVCAALAQRFDIEVGIVRLFALFSLCLSLGGTFLAYFVLYFILPQEEKKEKIISQ